MKNQKLYMQIYDYYKNLIEDGKLKEGTKLPSIRRCAEERNVSKTTVESAFMCLCDDGYILPKSQSGYYVSKRGNSPKKAEFKSSNDSEKSNVLYDFSSTGVDAESFNMDIWRRYLKSALRQTERLLFYGDPQGEYDLRQEIAKYATETRNCVCSEDNIVIGAGVQTLLNILCPLIKNRKTVCFDDLSYRQGTAIFNDYCFNVNNSREKSNIIYVSPSYSTRWGDVMSVKERFDLTEFARENNKLIIEDDYGSEFRYFNRPTPSLQGLDGGEGIVYLGTFSKLLLPSIRISFMILPQSLTKKYLEKKEVYNQTVSKADQIALCSYIRDGHLNSQIKKSRKIYVQKSKILTDLLIENFGKDISILKTNSPLYVKCRLNIKMSAKRLCLEAEKQGVLLIPANENDTFPEIAFSVATVGQESMENAVKILTKVVRNS